MSSNVLGVNAVPRSGTAFTPRWARAAPSHRRRYPAQLLLDALCACVAHVEGLRNRLLPDSQVTTQFTLQRHLLMSGVGTPVGQQVDAGGVPKPARRLGQVWTG